MKVSGFRMSMEEGADAEWGGGELVGIVAWHVAVLFYTDIRGVSRILKAF